MLLLTILNTLAIIYVFLKKRMIKFRVYKQITQLEKTLVSYDVQIGLLCFKIPIRNKRKTELNEEVRNMIANYSEHHKLQTLTAKFSQLTTWKEVTQFERDYEVVDRRTVDSLVGGFVPKCQIK